MNWSKFGYAAVGGEDRIAPAPVNTAGFVDGYLSADGVAGCVKEVGSACRADLHGVMGNGKTHVPIDREGADRIARYKRAPGQDSGAADRAVAAERRPASTVTAELAIEPFTRNSPSATVVVPE